MSISELLANSLSADHAVRQDATAKLEAASRENFPAYAAMLAQELGNEHASANLRVSAGIALKNTLSAREHARLEEYTRRWLECDAVHKNQVKTAVLNTLASNNVQAGGAAAQVVAAIAAIELPRGQWLELVPELLRLVTSTESTALKQSTLATIGYICEQIDPSILATQANNILTAVVQGARKEEPSQKVRHTALTALCNSLEFVRDNFEKEVERNFIMQVVCEATQSPDIDVQVAAFECLVRIVQLYYDKMAFYMEKALIALTFIGMKHEDDKVALQSVEFWSTICDVELELYYDAQLATDSGIKFDKQNHQFARMVVGDLTQNLTWLLTKKDEDEDEDEWTISMAAGTCLTNLASCVEDDIVPHLIPFIETNIRSAEWQKRDAAVMAFGSMLEGPDPARLGPMVTHALPVLIEMIQDANPQVRDSVAWTISRITDFMTELIRVDPHFPALIRGMIFGLESSPNPKSAGNYAWSIIHLAENLTKAGPSDNYDSYALSPFFDSLNTALWNACDKPSQDVHFRALAFEAMSSLVTSAAKDCLGTVEKLASSIMSKIEQSFAMQNQLVGVDDRNAFYELQANLCGVLTNIIRKMGPQVMPAADRIMQILLQLMTNAPKTVTVLEDAFFTVGSIASALEGEFVRYMDAFAPFLYSALQNHEEYQMCSVAIGTIGDIARAINDQLVPYCDTLMNLLASSLQSQILNKSVKPAILSCFGDIALAISSHFDKYLEIVMMVLHEAAMTKFELTTPELVEYAELIREGIAEAYVGIVQGMKTGGKVEMLLQHVPGIFRFVESVSHEDKSDDMLKAIIGLLGDLAEAFPSGQLKESFSQTWVQGVINEGSMQREDANMKELVKWTKLCIKQQTKYS